MAAVSNMDLTKSVAIVTGASRGIGRGIVEALLSRGAKVTIADIDKSTGDATTDELCNKFGPRAAIFVQCDVTKDTDLENAYKVCKETYGQVNIVVNNAGILDEGDWKKMLQVNLTAVIANTMLAIEHLTDVSGQPGGHVINISSLSGLYPDPLVTKYTATKFGVVGFTRAMAVQSDLGETPMKFNSILPCFVNTDLAKQFCELSKCTYSEDGKSIYLGSFTFQFMDPSTIGEAVIELLDKNINGAIVGVYHNQPLKYFEFEQFNL